MCQRQKRPLSHPDGGVTVTSLSRTSRAYGSPRLSPGDNRESLSSRYNAPMKRSFHGVAFTVDDDVVVVVTDAVRARPYLLRSILLLSRAFLSSLSTRAPLCFSIAMPQTKLLIARLRVSLKFMISRLAYDPSDARLKTRFEMEVSLFLSLFFFFFS